MRGQKRHTQTYTKDRRKQEGVQREVTQKHTRAREERSEGE